VGPRRTYWYWTGMCDFGSDRRPIIGLRALCVYNRLVRRICSRCALCSALRAVCCPARYSWLVVRIVFVVRHGTWYVLCV